MEGQLGENGDNGVATAFGRVGWRTGKRMIARPWGIDQKSHQSG